MRWSSGPGWFISGIVVLLWNNPLFAVEPTFEAVEYARIDDQPLLLDLYLPENIEQPVPLLIWIHGGAWRSGSRTEVPILGLVKDGFAVASVDYRLSPVAKFPAQVHDIKAAIRFLRNCARELNYLPDQFIVVGGSAGGHLAALVGVTNGHRELEGAVGSHLNVSSDVQGIVSFFGASDLRTILSQSTLSGQAVREPALELLLGGLPDKQPALARLASPVAHVDDNDPPLLLIHGDADPQMPIEQSREFANAYARVRRPVEFQVVPGGKHGGPEFYSDEMFDQMDRFLKTNVFPGRSN